MCTSSPHSSQNKMLQRSQNKMLLRQKRRRAMICADSIGVEGPPTCSREVAWLCSEPRRFDFGIWNREIWWHWKSILETATDHWPVQWEVPFGMGLSFYDIVIAHTARARMQNLAFWKQQLNPPKLFMVLLNVRHVSKVSKMLGMFWEKK